MARISEIHYSNNHASTTGIDEFFEVALSPGEDPADYVVSTYNQDGTVYLEIPLTDPGIVVTFDPPTQETVYLIDGSVYGFLLTDPDGRASDIANNEAVALTDVSGTSNVVIDFYDVGGGTTDIVAVDGAAAGVTSENLAGDYSYSIQFNQPDPDTPEFLTVSPGTTALPCFAAGTSILTDAGHKPIEDLAPGDLVQTMDNGLQPIRWIGFTTVCGQGRHAPYRIAAGAFGALSDVLVSPAHRIFVQDWRAELFFGQPEVLVSANKLQSHGGVTRVEQKTVTYFHMLFDQHEVIFSDGLASESFFPGPLAMSALDAETNDEILDLFPELRIHLDSYGPTARPILRKFEAELLMDTYG